MNQKFLQQLTDFIFVEDLPEKADIIFITRQRFSPAWRGGGRALSQGLCPLYPAFRPVQYLDRAFRRGPGKRRSFMPESMRTEWEFLKEVLVKNQVPQSAILREDQATYTLRECHLFQESY